MIVQHVKKTVNGKEIVIIAEQNENGKINVTLPNGEIQPCVNWYMANVVATVAGFDCPFFNI